MNRTGSQLILIIALLGALVFAYVPPAGAVTSMHQRVYLKAWESIKDNYYDRTKVSSWRQWEHKFDGKLRSKRELTTALDAMLDSLGDDYTFVLSDDLVRQRRTEQKSRSVSAVRILPDGIAYIKLDTFSGENVIGEMRRALRTVASAAGLVLDLRGNHGGFVNAAQDVFSMLANEGRFMTYDGFADGSKDMQAFVLRRDGWTVEKNGKVSHKRRKPFLLGNKPLVVLVDDETRSAAEMLAGALRVNGRALIVGKQTYGKGVLQDTFDLGEHLMVKVVTAKYYLPNGTNIHGTGIVPDVEMETGSESAVYQAAQMLRSEIAHLHRMVAGVEQSRRNL